MDNACLPIAEFITFLEVMKPMIVSVERIDDYIHIKFPFTEHVYEEVYGQVCHVLGIDSQGNVVRHERGVGT